jgi:hypothetical protein
MHGVISTGAWVGMLVRSPDSDGLSGTESSGSAHRIVSAWPGGILSLPPQTAGQLSSMISKWGFAPCFRRFGHAIRFVSTENDDSALSDDLEMMNAIFSWTKQSHRSLFSEFLEPRLRQNVVHSGVSKYHAKVCQ